MREYNFQEVLSEAEKKGLTLGQFEKYLGLRIDPAARAASPRPGGLGFARIRLGIARARGPEHRRG